MGRRGKNGNLNKLNPEDRPVHDWYRFVLSFPPHLVRDYLARFGISQDACVLDPFCGTGTTIVECQKHGIPSIGVEANPMAFLATMTKTDWSVDPQRLLDHAHLIADAALLELRTHGIEDNPILLSGQHPTVPLRTLAPEQMDLLLSDSISPLPLHKTLVLLDVMQRDRDDRYYNHERLALAKALVYLISNLHFGPEVGVSPPKQDAPVISAWLCCVNAMAQDLRVIQHATHMKAQVHRADARQLDSVLKPQSVDAVITSPPYPNEKDYTRTTRLESVLLGLINSKRDLQTLKRSLVRSNTRSVYRDDDDDRWILQYPEIHQIADAIEARRLELGKTSGFERMYPRVTRLYFGGMARHLAQLTTFLRPGAQLAYVVGDQASYLRIMIRTGKLLSDIATSLGYQLVATDLFRTRLATATGEQLREEVVILRWPGKQSASRSHVKHKRKAIP
ncbi:MAG: DNA methyltransferase [Planctomycetota bacterium]|nr:DNA methyltransferase [Planctomycetota bacterium]